MRAMVSGINGARRVDLHCTRSIVFKVPNRQ